MNEERTAPPLQVKGLTVAYRGRAVLEDVDFTAHPGLTAIVGPNGAGKSTLLKAILGLAPIAGGAVKVFGRPAARQRGRIAYMPQRESVDWDFPASALDVVTMGLYARIGWARPVRRRHREEALARLDEVGMGAFATRQIGQLSGGQQQRVFLARALAQAAEITFMDEPFAGVDAATEAAIATVLRRLAEQGRTVVAVHHDLSMVTEYFDHVLILNRRRIAGGPIETAFTSEALQAAYGGRLPGPRIAALAQ